MYTKLDLIKELKAMGIKSDDTLMIHSSFHSIKNIEGGASEVLNALKEVVCDGVVMLPTHTWATMKNDNDVMDKQEANSCVGYLTNMAIKDNDFIRSNHPTHSVAAYGKRAAKYIKDDDFAKTPASINGSFGKLRFGGKILFIGCPLSKNTYVHALEELYNVENRFTDHIYTFYTKLNNAQMMEFHMPRHFNKDCPHISDNYEKLLPIMLRLNIATKVKLMDSESYLVDASKLNELVKEILKRDIHAFDDNREINLD